MKNTLNQVFHAPKFLIGFIIFVGLMGFCLIYPFFTDKDPLEMYGNGNFFPPGTYVNQEEVTLDSGYTLNIERSAATKIASALGDNEVKGMLTYFDLTGVDYSEIDTTDKVALVELWEANYSDDYSNIKTTTSNKKLFTRIQKLVVEAQKDQGVIIAEKNEETGELEQTDKLVGTEYSNVNKLSSVITFVLGTDNFGRDVLTELVSATKASFRIGLLAGCIATTIGLLLGLLAGYVGGVVDNIITFVTNLFTVIPSFVILILISYSVGDSARGIMVVGIIIGCTSWPWTTRSVRSQVISLRNRDHVNLSKLSGHSMMRIILTDILPYIASYVVMALILQISSGILAEAQLSMIGLGPATTKQATLGLMMQWATTYFAHLNGSWWSYFPVVITIALMTFSMNLMNQGLDQVFNPQLRD
ncbi:MAG: ABC transporter permease [Lachnospiraceae bacterium]|nr:ABC transporter permease [Lachnospiraceae bacterium]